MIHIQLDVQSVLRIDVKPLDVTGTVQLSKVINPPARVNPFHTPASIPRFLSHVIGETRCVSSEIDIYLEISQLISCLFYSRLDLDVSCR